MGNDSQSKKKSADAKDTGKEIFQKRSKAR